jgi:hypothetical protein
MYGTAYRLQEFILHQYDPCRYPFDINDYKGGFDSRHLQIYQDMKAWFWEHGQASEGFRAIAVEIESRRIAQANSTFEELTRLREMRPEDYPHEPHDDQQRSYYGALENLEWHHKRNAAKGYIDE